MPAILIVDDADMDRKQAAKYLRGLQAKLTFASDGGDAWEQISRQPPDLIVTDLQMKPVGGMELLAKVRAEAPQIPVVVMTSRGSEETAVAALQLGAASYLPKRKLRQLLEETVQRVLGATRQRQLQHTLLEHRTRERVELQIENDLALVSPVVRLLTELGQDFGVFDGTRRIRISVAVEEAIVNAIVHGNLEVSSELREREDDEYHRLIEQRRKNAPWSSRKVRIVAEASPEMISYEICDSGPGFDLSTLKNPTDSENLLRNSGRGILLMRSFMDDVHYGQDGSQVRLIARRTETGEVDRVLNESGAADVHSINVTEPVRSGSLFA